MSARQAAADRLYAQCKTGCPRAMKVAGALVVGASRGNPVAQKAVRHLKKSHARMAGDPVSLTEGAAERMYRRLVMGDPAAAQACAKIGALAKAGHPGARKAAQALGDAHRKLRGNVSVSGRVIEPASMRKLAAKIYDARWNPSSSSPPVLLSASKSAVLQAASLVKARPDFESNPAVKAAYTSLLQRAATV